MPTFLATSPRDLLAMSAREEAALDGPGAFEFKLDHKPGTVLGEEQRKNLYAKYNVKTCIIDIDGDGQQAVWTASKRLEATRQTDPSIH